MKREKEDAKKISGIIEFFFKKSVFLDNFIVGCFILFKYFTTCNVLLVKSKY